MILADTSVWVLHLRKGSPQLEQLLSAGSVICHPCVVGELACGELKNRKEILSSLQTLPKAVEAAHAEVLHFIENNRLMGKGLGWVDAHLLVSARLSDAPLWSLDKRLNGVATQLKIAYKEA